MDGGEAKMNSISCTWSHLPFRRRRMTWLLRAAVHLTRRTWSQSSRKRNPESLSLSARESNPGVASAAVKDPFCLYPGALCNLTLPLSPMPPTLSSWCGLCALSDITTDTRQRGRVARYYSLTLLRSLQLYLRSSSRARLMLSKVLEAQPVKRCHVEDRFEDVHLAVVSL